MRGDAALRRELDAASGLRVAEDYRANLAALKTKPGHAISVLPDGRDRMARFNCFAYALGIWDHAEFVRMVDDSNNSAIADSRFVLAMLDEGALTEVISHQPEIGDIAIYFRDGSVTHAGAVSGNRDGLVLRSKWGGNEVHEHVLWEVPASYGDHARFFRAPGADMILCRLRARRP
jgi:hypothetical protein